MKYVIKDIIKRLTEAQKEGKELIDERELIRIATPQINNIDEVIRLIDKAIETLKANKDRYIFLGITIVEAAELTLISRPTFYRWRNWGIITLDNGFFDLVKLRETMLKIKKIRENITSIS
jgi:DNA invertase Pin-like site-specific DNA recombinase